VTTSARAPAPSTTSAGFRPNCFLEYPAPGSPDWGTRPAAVLTTARSRRPRWPRHGSVVVAAHRIPRPMCRWCNQPGPWPHPEHTTCSPQASAVAEEGVADPGAANIVHSLPLISMEAKTQRPTIGPWRSDRIRDYFLLARNQRSTEHYRDLLGRSAELAVPRKNLSAPALLAALQRKMSARFFL